MPEPLDYGRTPSRRPFPIRDLLIGLALSVVLYAALQVYIIHVVRANLAARAAVRSTAIPPATAPSHR